MTGEIHAFTEEESLYQGRQSSQHPPVEKGGQIPETGSGYSYEPLS